MAATIQFPNGLKATLLHTRGTWVCSEKEKEEFLRTLTEIYRSSEGLPICKPLKNLALGVAELAGAKLIHADPEPRGARGDLENERRDSEARERAIDPGSL